MTGSAWTLTVAGVIVLGALAVYLSYHLAWRREQKRKRAEREVVRAEWDEAIDEFRKWWHSG